MTFQGSPLLVHQPFAEVAYLYISAIVFVVYIIHALIKSFESEENLSSPATSASPKSMWHNNETYRENCGCDLPSDDDEKDSGGEDACDPGAEPHGVSFPAARCVITKEMMEAALVRSEEAKLAFKKEADKYLKKVRDEKFVADVEWLRKEVLGKACKDVPFVPFIPADEHTVCHRCGSSILASVDGKWALIPCQNPSCKVSSLTETTQELDYGMSDEPSVTVSPTAIEDEMDESDDAEREVENSDHRCSKCGDSIVDHVCGRWRRVPCSCHHSSAISTLGRPQKFICPGCNCQIVEVVHGEWRHASCGCKQLKFPNTAAFPPDFTVVCLGAFWVDA